MSKKYPICHNNLVVLEVAEPLELEALMADPEIGALLTARLSDHVAAALPQHFSALQAALLKKQHTPRIIKAG